MEPDDIDIFIDMVMGHDCLWNTGSREYRKAPLKLRIWKQIGEMMGKSGKQL